MQEQYIGRYSLNTSTRDIFLKNDRITEKEGTGEIFQKDVYKGDIFHGNILSFCLHMNLGYVYEGYFIKDEINNNEIVFLGKNIKIFLFTYLKNHLLFPFYKSILILQDIRGFETPEPHFLNAQERFPKYGVYCFEGTKLKLKYNFKENITNDFHLNTTYKEITFNTNNREISGNLNKIGEIVSTEKFHNYYKNQFLVYSSNLSSFFRDDYITGTGISSRKRIARLKGLSEGIERYCAGSFYNDTFHKKYLSNQEIQLLGDFSYFIGNDPTNTYFDCFPVQQLHIKGDKITFSDKNLYIPKEMLLYNVENKQIHIGSNSNGIAPHTSPYKAILNAYFELLERDSVALVWILKLTPNRILIDDNNLNKRINQIEKKYGYKITFFDVRLDKDIPIVLAVARLQKKKFPYFFASGSCKVIFYDAVTKSLDEIENMIITFDLNIKHFKNMSGNIPGTLKHMLFYAQPENFKFICFLFKNKKHIPLSQLDSVIYSLHNNQIHSHIYATDLTTFLTKKLGFYVFKVMNPRLIPFWFGDKYFPKKSIQERIDDLFLSGNLKGIYSDDIFLQYHGNDETISWRHFFG